LLLSIGALSQSFFSPVRPALTPSEFCPLMSDTTALLRGSFS
jgi:hypothetical protein